MSNSEEKFASPEEFQQLKDALDLLEIERLNAGFWKIYAQFLITRVDPNVANNIAEGVRKAILDARGELDENKWRYVQEALHDFVSEVKNKTT